MAHFRVWDDKDLAPIAAVPDMIEALTVCCKALFDHLQFDNPEDEQSLEAVAYNSAMAALKKAGVIE